MTRERIRPHDFMARGAVLALVCAGLFALRDNLVRWVSRDQHPPPLLATQSLWAVAFAAVVIGRSEAIGSRLVVASVLSIAGGALISVVR